MGMLRSEEERLSFFVKLVDENRSKLLRFAKARIHNHHDAEDVTQEMLCSAWEKVDELLMSPNPSGWLMTTLKHHILHFYDKEVTRKKVYEALEFDCADNVTLPDYRDDRLILETLSADEARIVKLKESGYTHHEISRILMVPYGTIASKVSRIKVKVGMLLSEPE